MKGYKWRPTVSLTPFLNVSDVDSETKKPADDPCSHWYPGRRPYQAPEVNHLAVFVEGLPNLKAFVDLRSYGQMCTCLLHLSFLIYLRFWHVIYFFPFKVSSPFSYTCKKMPKDAENQLEASLGAINALKKPFGTSFMVCFVSFLCGNLSYLFIRHSLRRLEACARCFTSTSDFRFFINLF